MRPRLFALSIVVFLYYQGTLPLLTTGYYGCPSDLYQGVGAEVTGLYTNQDNNEEQSWSLPNRDDTCITAMEGLDLVQKKYASNFTKEYVEGKQTYYYKLPIAEYYLVYEGEEESTSKYLFHLYEYVLDEPEDGIGHYVTYGWYSVDMYTGEIIEIIQ